MPLSFAMVFSGKIVIFRSFYQTNVTRSPEKAKIMRCCVPTLRTHILGPDLVGNPSYHGVTHGYLLEVDRSSKAQHQHQQTISIIFHENFMR